MEGWFFRFSLSSGLFAQSTSCLLCTFLKFLFPFSLCTPISFNSPRWLKRVILFRRASHWIFTPPTELQVSGLMILAEGMNSSSPKSFPPPQHRQFFFFALDKNIHELFAFPLLYSLIFIYLNMPMGVLNKHKMFSKWKFPLLIFSTLSWTLMEIIDFI